MSSSPRWETINGVRYPVVEVISALTNSHKIRNGTFPQQPLQATLVTGEEQQAFVEYVPLPSTDGGTITFVKKE